MMTKDIFVKTVVENVKDFMPEGMVKNVTLNEIRGINTSEVEPEDRLTDAVYLYRVAEGKLKKVR